MNDALKTTFKNFADYMLEPHRPTNGISGLNSIRFYLVFAPYSASFLVLMRDPFFFQYQAGVSPKFSKRISLKTAFITA